MANYVIRWGHRGFWDGAGHWVTLPNAAWYTEEQKAVTELPRNGEWYIPREFRTAKRRRRIIKRDVTLYSHIEYQNGTFRETYVMGATRSRNELAALIREAVEFYKFPRDSYQQIRIIDVYADWVNLGFAGKFVIITDKHRQIFVSGMSEAEFNAMVFCDE